MTSDIQTQLKSLRSILPLDGEERRIFDEFFREQEFGLALHVVCDYVLDPSSARVDETAINHIRQLHSAMDVDDDCVPAIIEKANTIQRWADAVYQIAARLHEQARQVGESTRSLWRS